MTSVLVEKLSDVRDFRKILETTVKEIGETYSADLSQIVLSNPLDTNITSICEYLSNPDEIPRHPQLTTFPLTLEGGGLGVLNIARAQDLNADEINEIRIALAEISNVIRYAQINDLVQRDTFRSAFMSEISSMMQMSMGLGDTLFMVVNILGKALNCSRCIFVATDGDAGWKCYEYWQRERGIESSQEYGWPTRDSAVVSRALLSQFPVVTFEGQVGSYLTPGQEEMQFIGVRSLLAVGIRSSLGVHGCIILQQCDSRRAWTRAEMDMLQSVADTIAEALVQLPDEKRNLEPIMRMHQRLVADTKDADQQSMQDVRRALKGVLGQASIPNARKVVSPDIAVQVPLPEARPQMQAVEPEYGSDEQWQADAYQTSDEQEAAPPPLSLAPGAAEVEAIAPAVRPGQGSSTLGGLADLIADQAEHPVPESSGEQASAAALSSESDPMVATGGKSLTGLLGGILGHARIGASSAGAWDIETTTPLPPDPVKPVDLAADQVSGFAVETSTSAESFADAELPEPPLAEQDAAAPLAFDADESSGLGAVPKAFSGSWGQTGEADKVRADAQSVPAPTFVRPAVVKPGLPGPSAALPSEAVLDTKALDSIPTPQVRSPGLPPRSLLGQLAPRGTGSGAPLSGAASTSDLAVNPQSDLNVSAGAEVDHSATKPAVRNELLEESAAESAAGKVKPASKWGDLDAIPAAGQTAEVVDQSLSGSWGNLDAIPTPSKASKGLGSAMLGKARMAAISTPGGGLGSSFHKDRNRSGQFVDGPPLEIDEAEAEAKLKQILSTSNPTSDYIFATQGVDPRVLGRIDHWVSLVEQKDKYMNGHARAVAEYATAIARLLGLSLEEVTNIRLAALAHDIGKLKSTQALLQTPAEELNDAELVQTMEHPLDGAKLLKGIPELESLAGAVLYHHEEFDGKGYPEGLVGEDIPLYARIIHVADGYHERVSELTYRAGLSPADAQDEMRASAGGLYDPAIVEALLACIAQGLVPATM